LGQIFLHDEKRWYKANTTDIKEIKTNVSRKEITIHFRNFDMVLSCKEYAHLMALRDFLFLTQNIPVSQRLMPPVASIMNGDNKYPRKYGMKMEKLRRSYN
jgi:hypothetical protein